MQICFNEANLFLFGWFYLSASVHPGMFMAVELR